MPYEVNVIETGSLDYPQTLKITDNSARYPQIWAIGNLEILNKKLLGFFCSVKCPGGIILKTYDLARSFRDDGIPLIYELGSDHGERLVIKDKCQKYSRYLGLK